MGKSCAPGPIPPYRQQQELNNLHSGEYFQEQSSGWRFTLAVGVGCLLAAAAGLVWMLSP